MRWLTISPSGRVDVIICGRWGTRRSSGLGLLLLDQFRSRFAAS
ncbi:uncharacterized protein LOC100278403 [Zea mays]|uniref:Uncharacterized protein n=1 Tax=Zea mays TaxID=4577 RepID=B6TW49_MAIZE|nr:uncharacterized protein LOC100278403 [Zea mays]ACG41332.1 hypothetical protein [Zea mays]ACG45550.1 hypothetical protein [Zea mays]|eukprot:NP_001316125.1 uncharacterized protein LOC100278403 [Zea mays]